MNSSFQIYLSLVCALALDMERLQGSSMQAVRRYRDLRGTILFIQLSRCSCLPLGLCRGCLARLGAL